MNTLLNTCREWAQPFTDLAFVKAALATASVILGFMFGVEFFNFIFLVLWLVVLDTITGIWAAKVSGVTISSARFIRTVTKILRYMIFVASGHALQNTIGVNLYVENVIFIFLATTEFISIAENLGKAGMPIPHQLLNKIEELRDRQ